MSIISNFEIRQKSVVGKDYATDNLSRFKDVIEGSYLRNCFGKTFHDILKADAIDWSELTEWEAGTYALNDVVIWKGEALKSTVNGNTQEPSLTASQWTAAKKFSISELDNLWKVYLGQIVANKIIMACIVPDTFRATAKGLMVSTEDLSNVEPVDKSGLGLWYSHINNFIDTAEREMKTYMQDQYDLFKANPSTGYDYSNVNFISGCETCITTSNKVNRKIGFDD